MQFLQIISLRVGGWSVHLAGDSFKMLKQFLRSYSKESIINKFYETHPKVPDDKTDESSECLLRITNHSLLGL